MSELSELDFFDWNWDNISKHDVVNVVVFVISQPELYEIKDDVVVFTPVDIFEIAMKSCVQFQDFTIEYFFYADTGKFKNADIMAQGSLLFSAFLKHFWSEFILPQNETEVVEFDENNENYELDPDTMPKVFEDFLQDIDLELD